ncbi:hypothetical protein F5Y16DRAFT_358334 [Xylariaceae sp. FL0255]|nr:hypothetical protein F5Y16DRAFT_358334 [Xylariaceae sp. FL0255]
MNPPRKPCFLFRKGNCTYGVRCKYSHDSSNSSRVGNQRGGQPSATPAKQQQGQHKREEDDLREWKRLLHQGRQSPTHTTCDRFFELVVKLTDGDPGGMQEAIKLLAGEDGLAYIRRLVEHHAPSATSDRDKRDLWTTQMSPLFTAITHPRVADSAVLEQQVATIYNYMQGIGSQRMIRIFTFAIRVAQLCSVNSHLYHTRQIPSQLAVVESSLAVLSKMVDCNTSNIVDGSFKTIVQQFGSMLANLDEKEDDYLVLQSRKWIDYINRRVALGDELPLLEERGLLHNTGFRAEFQLPRNLPGILSASGPRHDNDHADITNISILPTHDEIISIRQEYLPTKDPSSFHRPGIIGRIDREFRLLREDTVGQLRDVVRDLLEQIQGHLKTQHRERRSLLKHTYQNAVVVDASFEPVNGLSLVVRFPQPMAKTKRQRRLDWWVQSKRLQPGALVCIISSDGSVVFCVVTEATEITSDAKIKRGRPADASKEVSKQERLTLGEDDEYSYVHLKFADPRENDIRQALRWFQNIGSKRQQWLAEFPGVLLASFQHTLEALQRMSKAPNVPFIDLIAPSTQSSSLKDIPPPYYTTKPGFHFDLSCLAKGKTPMTFSPTQGLGPQVLMKQSTLDETQSVALLNSLSRSLALIQGPPGTGKSYTGEKIIKVLLANKTKAVLGPILCVCYTNHALDQLLEHLLDDGVQQIIRIGSRSKSERLEEANLRCVARNADRTKAEKSSLWEARNALDGQSSTLSKSLQQLQQCLGRPALKAYLAGHYPKHHEALFGTLVDKEGYQEVRRDKQSIDQWLRTGQDIQVASGPRQVEQLLAADLWTMSHQERHRLHSHWKKQIRDPIIQNILLDHREYVAASKKRARVNQEVDLRCLSAADIVGVTTTGLAKNIDLLRRLRCKVLICEEAGEVLEAHNLTALLPSIEHCILIGDQLQLRPQIQNYDLNSTNPRGEQYSLDVSLFERLVSPSDGGPRLPFDTLKTQRRMHPKISELIRQTLYPSLVDGDAVSEYPEVLGVRQRLFWLQHTELEDRAQQQDPTSTSHTNSFEVDMTTAFVQHLVRQGTYASSDIAVLTPYLGQLSRLRKRMQSLFQISIGDRDLEELAMLDANQNERENQQDNSARLTSAVTRTTLLKSIRLATVDNFQGEEAKVVVISLVRSNNEQRCGFLSTSNRINVLLSRAQHGMYIFGNANTYARVPMWEQVLTILQDTHSIGPTLPLQCPRHPDYLVEVSMPDHFLQFCPEGGCNRQCDQRLYCGHACINRCHSQMLHNAVKCLEACPRMKKGCEHPCRLACGDTCEPKCTERLQNLNIVLSCGHKRETALCWQAQVPSSILCEEKRSKVVPGCGHTVVVPCCVDVAADSYRCTSLCGDLQPCGHACSSECHRCKDRKGDTVVSEHHEVCRQVCNRAYTTCRHACQQSCHGVKECPPCLYPCDVRCSHSKCNKKCHEPCAPCAEQVCSSACPHQKCTMPCAAPCNWIPCSRRCEQLLDCGHQCPSLCGEACPGVGYCQICCNEDIKTIVVDLIMCLQYHETNLDEDPCIFPDCGHILTKFSMDGLMDLKSHYQMSDEESPNPLAISSSSMPFSMDEVKTCPSCRGPLRNIARYGRIVRRATLDEATKKFIAWSHREYLELADRLVNLQESFTQLKAPEAKLQASRSATLKITRGRLQQLHKIQEWVGNSRYNDAIRLWARISTFVRQVQREEQPLQRVADLVRHASRQQQNTCEFSVDESVIQVKGMLQSSLLLLKCELAVFIDFMAIRQPLMNLRPEISLDLTKAMKECEILIDMASSAQYHREQVEGHIYFAQFCAFAHAMNPEPSDDSTPAKTLASQWTDQGNSHVAVARDLITQFPSTRILEAQLNDAEKMLRGAVFYTQVSAEEMRAVYKAMAQEFSGTGHWYTCANGHPFTIGECGMPMQAARCPECDAPVGGQHHQAAEGVTRAEGIEALARDIDRLGL